MDKLQMKSANGVQDNIKKIEALFPDCVTETIDADGKLVRKIDFEKLQQNLSDYLISDKEERYQFTWPDKKKAVLLANAPINATLRPCREESVDFDNTQNLYIEGDNLDVLKCLKETYLHKVKMIYIDPPYNTGNDFVYEDDFAESAEEYRANSGQYDEQGRRLVANTESNGRFHTDWLNMIYPRLKVARDLLTDDGVIFISIDDNEVRNLRIVCDEIFGEKNFIAQIIVDGTPKNDPYVISTAHEYCLVYAKDFSSIKDAEYGIRNPLFDELLDIYKKGGSNYKEIEHSLKSFFEKDNLQGDNICNYNKADEYGIFRIGPIDDPQSSGPKDLRLNPKTGRNCATPTSGWRCTVATWEKWISEHLIEFPDTDDVLPAKKTYITEDRLDVMHAIFKMQTRKDTDMLKKLFGLSYTPFSNPKPMDLISSFIENCNDKHMIVLDFFSGSGTTQHAIFRLNSKDQGKRKCISVQCQETITLSGKSNKQKKISQAAISFLDSMNRPHNICEIAKERIRRAGKKILEEQKAKQGEKGLFSEQDKAKKLDTGFRVLKLDSTNMQDIYYSPADTNQADLFSMVDNVKADRTPEDLLFQVMLELGATLDSKIERMTIEGKSVFNVANGFIVACFDKDVSDKVVTAIAKKQPLYAVIRDSSMADDSTATNFEQIFKTYSPNTTIKIL